MQFSTVLKALTGAMAFGGANAAVIAPRAGSGDVAIEARELDKSQIAKCAACTFAASKGIEQITGFGKDDSGFSDLIKDVGRSWAGKQICEHTEWLSSVGGPFCKDGNNIKEGEDKVDGQSTKEAAEEVGKTDPDFGSSITDKVKTLGLTTIATKLLGSVF